MSQHPATKARQSKQGPALWKHVQTIYNEMDEHAERAEIDGDPIYIWEGAVTVLFSKFQIGNIYYGPTQRALQDMGCIKRLRKGNSQAPSMYAILKKPERHEFDEWHLEKRVKPRRGQNQRQIDVVKAQLNDLAGQIGGIDIKKAFIELNKQVNELRVLVSAQGKEISKLRKAQGLDSTTGRRVGLSQSQSRSRDKKGDQ